MNFRGIESAMPPSSRVPVAHGDDLRRQGQEAEAQEAVQVLVVTRQAVVVDGPTGADVSPHDVEVHGGVGVGLPVKDIQLVRDLPVAEVRPEEITGLDPRAHAAISWVLAKGQVVAQHPPDLVGFIVAPNTAPAETPTAPSKTMFCSIITSMTPAVNKPRIAPPSITNPCFMGIFLSVREFLSYPSTNLRICKAG